MGEIVNEEVKSGIIVWLLSLVPYVLLSWGYTALIDGHARDFWIAMGALFAARLFFGIIEGLGGILVWRLYGKRVMVRKFLTILQQGNFPKRKYSHYDFGSQIAWMQGNDEFSAELQTAARDWQIMAMMTEQRGILSGMRLHSAAEAAYDIYSPKTLAPDAFPANVKQDDARSSAC